MTNRARGDGGTGDAPSGWFVDGEAEVPDGSGNRVLILGCAPLPFENQKMNFAPGLRTWQFAKPLADDGHTVVVLAMRIPGSYEDGAPPIDRISNSGVVIYTMDEDLFRREKVIEEAVDLFQPDVMIGVSSSAPCLRAVELAGDRPLWIDLFGDLMAEAQARQAFHPDADLIPHRDVLVALLERGDAFSAVSDRQRYSAMGQLGLVGRLNQATQEAELIRTIPCCVLTTNPTKPDNPAAPDPAEFEDGDFVLLWGGGFNTWCDIDTLFEGVELAMAANGTLRLAVTGGAIRGHDDLTYPRFLDRVRRSRFSDRFVIKGQLDTREADAYCRRADLGVVTEKMIPERLLGSSGRILHWLSEGLPLVCTDLSELGSILAGNDLAWTYRPGDPKDLARAILEVAGESDRGRGRAERARDYAFEHWSIAATTRQLRRWISDHGRSADAGSANPLSLVDVVDAGQLRRATGELDALRAEFNQTRSELGKIHHSRMWKVWMFYLGLAKIFGRGREDRAETTD